MKVTCIVCRKDFEVTDAQYKLMTKIGVVTCSYECAMQWMKEN